MFALRIAFFYLTRFLAVSSTTAASVPQGTTTVNLRVEGENVTYFEGLITSGPRNISLPQDPGGPPFSWPCNGLNFDANPTPGNTPLDALDAAAKASGFTYDGLFSGEFSDFQITRVSTSTGSYNSDGSVKYWGQLVNYQIYTATHLSGSETLILTSCQPEVKAGDEVLWAFLSDPPGDTSVIAGGVNLGFLLKLAPTAVTVKKGTGFTVTVTDGRTGTAVQNASVDGVHTDGTGKATLYLFDTGFFQFKAHKTGDVRSNVMNVTVTS